MDFCFCLPISPYPRNPLPISGILFQQLCPKFNPCGLPCSRPTPGSLWCLDLTQMVLAVRKKLKSTHLNIPNNFCFNNFVQKSIPGVVLAEVLQEPVGASHGHQGRKSGVQHPFSDPRGQEESNGTPHLSLASKGTIPQGRDVVGLYIRIPTPQVLGTIGFLLTPRVS